MTTASEIPAIKNPPANDVAASKLNNAINNPATVVISIIPTHDNLATFARFAHALAASIASPALARMHPNANFRTSALASVVIASPIASRVPGMFSTSTPASIWSVSAGVGDTCALNRPKKVLRKKQCASANATPCGSPAARSADDEHVVSASVNAPAMST